MAKNLLFSVTRKDLDVSYFSSHGPGGQKRNKVKNCVRLHHRESGGTGVGQNHRELSRNKKEALEALLKNNKFKIWWHRRVHEELEKETVEEKLDKLMASHNLKTEVQIDGKWQPWSDNETVS